MKALITLVFFPIMLVLIGTLGFMYVIGAVIATAIVAAVGLRKK